MWLLLGKTLVSALILVAVSEISKRSGTLGGLVASLPLTSILAMIWLYAETKNSEKVITLSWSIFWMVIPSLVFFVIFPILLKRHIPFVATLSIACVITMMAYYGAFWLYGKLGIAL